MSEGDKKEQGTAAVLISGGLDSSILLGEAVQLCAAVHPLFVRNGLTWETIELDYLRRFLDAVRCPALQPLEVLDMPVRDVYGSHWSVTGRGVPDADSPDEAVFLPARNVLLLSKAMLWCHLNSIATVMLATLRSNPFPDATPAFFKAFEDAVNQALQGSVRIARPYEGLSKPEVLLRGRELPLELTFSCINPSAGFHCGICNKCAERRGAFVKAGLHDRTAYAPRGGRDARDSSWTIYGPPA